MSKPDALLLLAFGGPEAPDEIRPFLRRVVAGRPVPEARLEEVAHHYELLGGRSPLGPITRELAVKLERVLESKGHRWPVRVGMRFSEPGIEEALARLSSEGHRDVVGLILAAHESPASHGRYRQAVEQAQARLGDAAPRVRYAQSFHEHPGFIAAHVDHVQQAFEQLGGQAREQADLIFTAHSIPTPVAQRSAYARELQRSATLVARAFGRAEPIIAYQSRSGAPSDPWLEPDVNDLLHRRAAQGVSQVVLCPVGFVCDHVEVLYDLDVEAAQTAAELGLSLARAKAPNTHPAFVEALAQLAATPA